VPPPTVSVVLPVRNGIRFLPEALESILEQTFGDFELIVMDDGSTDGTMELLDGYRKRDSRIHVYRREHRGLVASLNEGRALASGRYVAIMHADDVAFAERLERQVRHLDANPPLALLGTGHTQIDSEGLRRGKTSYPASPEEVAQRLASKNCIAHPTVMFRRAMLDRVGSYRAPFFPCEDYDLWLRASEVYPLANLPEPLLAYRVHESSVSRTHLRQGVIALFAAQTAASLRRKGADDNFIANQTELSLQVLERVGLDRRVVEAGIFSVSFAAALDALNRGSDAQALLLARGALESAEAAHLSREARAPVHRVAALASWHLGAPLKASRWALAGILAHPATLSRRIRGLTRNSPL
jgi:glycosyltransferase involved in cell wall biosynthesis